MIAESSSMFFFIGYNVSDYFIYVQQTFMLYLKYLRLDE